MLKMLVAVAAVIACFDVQAQQPANTAPGAPLNASEDVSKCDSVLVPDLTIIQSNLTVLASFLRIIDESNYQQYKQQYSATFPDYFSGDFSQFDEARRRYYQKESFNLEIFQAKSILQSVVNSDKVNAWLQCVTNTTYGLFAYINDVNEDGATLTIQWVPPAGLAKLSKPLLSLDQATSSKPNNFESVPKFTGSAEVLLRRDNKGAWVRGTASGVAGSGGSYSSKFYIPPSPQSYTVNIDETSPSSMLFETRFWVPSSPQPKDIEFTVVSSTTQTGEHFTQCCRLIQQYVWVDGNLTYDSGELPGPGEGQPQTLTYTQKVKVQAGHQVEVRVRNNGKGAKTGPTTLHWTGQYQAVK